MKTVQINTAEYADYSPRGDGTPDRRSNIAIVAFVAALPALAAFVMWLADPQGTASFYATRTGQTLFYAGFIWIGIGMLRVRRMVFSRTIRPRLSPAW